MIYRKSSEELASMQKAGRILADCLSEIEMKIVPGATPVQLDQLFADLLKQAGAKASFKGYRGFPASLCSSPNEAIVHGIPSGKPLDEGDILSIDLGVFYEGFHADSAWTFPVGEIDDDSRRLLEVTEASLEAAVEQCEVGNRTGDIGYAVEQVVLPAGFTLVQEYAGHGIGRTLHEEPSVPNYGPPGRGAKLAPGMTLAIEPMVNAGGPATETIEDGWTIVTRDRSRSAHFEHTVAITADGPLVLTARN